MVALQQIIFEKLSIFLLRAIEFDLGRNRQHDVAGPGGTHAVTGLLPLKALVVRGLDQLHHLVALDALSHSRSVNITHDSTNLVGHAPNGKQRNIVAQFHF